VSSEWVMRDTAAPGCCSRWNTQDGKLRLITHGPSEQRRMTAIVIIC
jgi:hypothetical protein